MIKILYCIGMKFNAMRIYKSEIQFRIRYTHTHGTLANVHRKIDVKSSSITHHTSPSYSSIRLMLNVNICMLIITIIMRYKKSISPNESVMGFDGKTYAHCTYKINLHSNPHLKWDDKSIRKLWIVESNFAKLMPFVNFHRNNNSTLKTVRCTMLEMRHDHNKRSVNCLFGCIYRFVFRGFFLIFFHRKFYTSNFKLNFTLEWMFVTKKPSRHCNL